MLGRKDYTKQEIDQARTAVHEQLAAYEELSTEGNVSPALEAFEPRFVNAMILALDRAFVHRVRPVTGKDGTPLNELELLAESLMNNDGVLRGNDVIKYVPDASILKLELVDRIELTAGQFERLAEAVLAEIESKFLEAS